MSAFLISNNPVYRADTEEEAKQLIEKFKNTMLGDVSKYNCQKKEVKVKSEVVDEYYLVSITSVFTTAKEPDRQVEVFYDE